MTQLILLLFALGGTVGFASTPPNRGSETCGSCQLYYDYETGIKESATFKESSEALYAVLDVNPSWPFDKPIASEKWGCSCERNGYSPVWLAPNGLCWWFDQQKNQDELLRNDNITQVHRRACEGAGAGGRIAGKQGEPAILKNHNPLCLTCSVSHFPFYYRRILLPSETLCQP